jgi:hypothetical protein
VTSFVSPRSRDTARALLSLAEQQGLPPEVVLTTEGGYKVPDTIGDAYAASLAPATPEPQTDPPARTRRKAQDKETP